MESAWEMCKRTMESILHFLGTIIDTLLFMLSAKVFPFAWHARSYYSFLFRHKLDGRPVPLTTPHAITVFQPTIWTSSTPLGEIDIMGHKTNSTYATDFDVARSYHICSMFRVGLKMWSGLSFVNPQGRGDETELFYPALAGVSFTFHRAIRPRQKYEISTRILSWDDKWLYLISHFVERGACKPAYFSDRKKPQHDPELNLEVLGYSQSFDYENGSQSSVFATGMAKMVFKKGRKTIPPSQFLSDCGLLPQQGSDAAHLPDNNCKEKVGLDDEELTKLKESIEVRRAMGYQVAQHLNNLDKGSSVFNVAEKIFYSRA